MKRTLVLLTIGSLALNACSDDAAKANNATNNATTSTNNATTATNNATTATNNGTTSTNNGTTATNNGTTSTNNGTTATNNGTTATNNGTTATNNGTTSTNNGTTSTNNGTTGTCDTNGFTLVDQQYYPEPPDLFLSAVSSTTKPNDALDLEFYGNDSPLMKGPGTYLLAATTDDQNYASCSTCLVVKQNCAEATPCETLYFATGGEIVVDTVTNGVFTGKLVNVTLEEVEIDGDTFTSTPVAAGRTWCIAESAFNTTAQ